jgi:hypothetical protein
VGKKAKAAKPPHGRSGTPKPQLVGPVPSRPVPASAPPPFAAAYGSIRRHGPRRKLPERGRSGACLADRDARSKLLQASDPHGAEPALLLLLQCCSLAAPLLPRAPVPSWRLLPLFSLRACTRGSPSVRGRVAVAFCGERDGIGSGQCCAVLWWWWWGFPVRRGAAPCARGGQRAKRADAGRVWDSLGQPQPQPQPRGAVTRALLRGTGEYGVAQRRV